MTHLMCTNTCGPFFAPLQARPGCGSDGRGFGHIGFLVDDVYAACDFLEPLGFGFKKKPDEGEFSRPAIHLLGRLLVRPFGRH